LLKSGFGVIAYEIRGHHRTNMGKVGAFAMQDLVNDLHHTLPVIAWGVGEHHNEYAANIPNRKVKPIDVSSSELVVVTVPNTIGLILY